MPTAGNLEYSLQEYSGPEYCTTGPAIDALTATSLSVALSLFAGGLKVMGRFGRYRMRKPPSNGLNKQAIDLCIGNGSV